MSGTSMRGNTTASRNGTTGQRPRTGVPSRREGEVLSFFVLDMMRAVLVVFGARFGRRAPL
jgi:hypothetical protein